MENSILYSEINVICILILLLLSIKIKKSVFLQEQRRLFLAVTIANILFLALDAAWIFINNNVIGITVTINWVLNYAYYILSGFVGFLWFQYAETIQESVFVREKRYRFLSYIPMVLLIALTLVSYKTGWLFYIDSNNVYHRGPAYCVQLICAYGYVIFTAAKALILSFRTDNYRQQQDLRTLSIFVVPTLLAGTLQIFFPRYPILCIGNTMGLLYVHLSLQEQLVSIDALTRLNNRNQMFQYLSSKFAHPNHERVLYLILMDVDYFKSINDQYGHVEGDRALKTVANCLMKACSDRHFFISRYGGDEFLVICELEPNESIQAVCDSIHNEFKNISAPYTLSVSIGYAKYTSEIKNQQDFIAKADVELYKAKGNRKGVARS